MPAVVRGLAGCVSGGEHSRERQLPTLIINSQNKMGKHAPMIASDLRGGGTTTKCVVVCCCCVVVWPNRQNLHIANGVYDCTFDLNYLLPRHLKSKIARSSKRGLVL